jgi:hypothetical protein
MGLSIAACTLPWLHPVCFDTHRDAGLAALGGRQLREQLVEVAHVKAAICRCQVLLSLQTMETPVGCHDVACDVRHDFTT